MAAVEEGSYDVNSILSSSGRDFLIRNNGDKVEIHGLKGKKVGLYFSASWCEPHREVTTDLVEVYNECAPKGDFEIIFISRDNDDEAFNAYFSEMPWLAIPFSDSETRDSLTNLFKVWGMADFVIIDENGKVVTENGTMIVRHYGVDAYPFTLEKINELKEEDEKIRHNQSLTSLLTSRSRDYVISNDGKKVPVSELEGKIVGLYIFLSAFDSISNLMPQLVCSDFQPLLVEFYEKLKAQGESFEVVAISLDNDENSFKQAFGTMPWLSLPFKDKSCLKLARYFELSALPSLVIIGSDGKTLHPNVVETVEKHGVLAYPFSPEKFKELEEIEKAKMEAQTLESILVKAELDFVIGKDGTKILVSDLVGKHILIYFSAHWCPPCRAFLPKLIEAYQNIKAKDDAFELIFVSSDRDQATFDSYFAEMPWLALPFGDERRNSLSRIFKVSGIPTLVAIGPSGKTITTDARALMMAHGADAYPFTEEILKEIEKKCGEMAKEWPEKLKHPLHEEHELVRTRRGVYRCDGCSEEGLIWSFYCEKCDFYLHPKCALGEGNVKEGKDDSKEEESHNEGWVCVGDVCRKA
ncbi:Thioredoxin-like fold [Dillenia turbinata]|uniref:protein-disulfide reductase n=1 Tax=Dillenia turbinata TaxID=194707 RepID=A0AAN8UZX6_9MAGN